MTDHTIDSEVDEILKDLQTAPQTQRVIDDAAHTIKKLIAQEANKARIDEVKRFPFSKYLNNTKIYKDDRIAQLEKGSNNG